MNAAKAFNQMLDFHDMLPVSLSPSLRQIATTAFAFLNVLNFSRPQIAYTANFITIKLALGFLEQLWID